MAVMSELVRSVRALAGVEGSPAEELLHAIVRHASPESDNLTIHVLVKWSAGSLNGDEAARAAFVLADPRVNALDTYWIVFVDPDDPITLDGDEGWEALASRALVVDGREVLKGDLLAQRMHPYFATSTNLDEVLRDRDLR